MVEYWFTYVQEALPNKDGFYMCKYRHPSYVEAQVKKLYFNTKSKRWYDDLSEIGSVVAWAII